MFFINKNHGTFILLKKYKEKSGALAEFRLFRRINAACFTQAVRMKKQWLR